MIRRRYDDATRERARVLYDQGVPVLGICAELGVRHSAVDYWRKSERWPLRTPSKAQPAWQNRRDQAITRWRCACEQLNARTPCTRCGAVPCWVEAA
jgi:uncharacterized protein YjcR